MEGNDGRECERDRNGDVHLKGLHPYLFGNVAAMGGASANGSVTVKESFPMGDTLGTGALGLYGTQLLPSTTPWKTTRTFRIGRNASPSGTTQASKARITKVSLLKRVPTSAEIAAWAAYGVPGDTDMPADFSLFLKMDEASNASSFADSSGNSQTFSRGATGLTRVAGPLGTDFAQQFTGTSSEYLERAIVDGDPAQIPAFASSSFALGCAVDLDTLPLSSEQQVFCGQIAIGLGAPNDCDLASCLYLYGGTGKFQADVCAGDRRNVDNNLAVVSSTTPTTATWYHELLVVNRATNTAKLYINGLLETTFSIVAQPTVQSGFISGGSAHKFEPVTAADLSAAPGTSGYEGVGRYLYKRPSLGNLAITHGTDWVIGFAIKMGDTVTLQTPMGIYDAGGGFKANWAIQQSAGVLYFEVGSGALNVLAYCFVTLNDTNWHIVRLWADFSALKVKGLLDNATAFSNDGNDGIGFTVGMPAINPEFRIAAATTNTGFDNSAVQQFNGQLQGIVIGTGAPDATFDAKLWNSGAGTLAWGP